MLAARTDRPCQPPQTLCDHRGCPRFPAQEEALRVAGCRPPIVALTERQEAQTAERPGDVVRIPRLPADGETLETQPHSSSIVTLHPFYEAQVSQRLDGPPLISDLAE